MPYRAMFTTIVTVAFALIAVGMWVRAVSPMLASAPVEVAGTTMAATMGADGAVHPPPERALRMLVKGVLLVSFVLICLLLLVGFFATFREWVRYSTSARQGRKKTPYVDAWKIAGERMKVKEEPGNDEE